MAPPDPSEFDAQDTAEVLDETHLTEDGGDIANFDEIADVYDVTTALGDTRDDAAMDEADFDAAAVDYVDSDEEEEVDDHLRDELEDVPEDNNLDPDSRDEQDGVTRESAVEVELKSVSDIDALTDPAGEDAETYESNRLSDEETQALGYPSEKEKQDAGAPKGSGAAPDDVVDERDSRQEELLDEGLEESFPASDPVSVKRIT